MKKIVIFGGGSGLSQLLKGLKLFPVFQQLEILQK